jgi:hypothetical protein
VAPLPLTEEPPKAAPSIDSGSYNWHPAVHEEHFEETLYFVLVRLHEPLHRPVAEQTRELLSGAGIKYACAYPLFGSWDALVRVWLTSASYKRFIRVLQDSVEHKSAEHNIEDYRGFSTSEIRYFWSDTNGENLLAPDKDVKTAMASNNADIDRIAERPSSTDPEVLAMCKRLADEELMFSRPPMPPGGVKFYTCLERASVYVSPQREVERILEAMRATAVGESRIPMIDRSSLYCGDGSLAAYLVRSVADGFDDVLALAESFDRHLKETGLRPMTLLVANPDAVYESDSANNHRHFNPNDNRTVELLELQHDVIAGISAGERTELNSLVVQACELTKSEDTLQQVLLRILKATALNDHEEFRASLAFLLNFEPEFKKRLVREFFEVFGEQWLVEIRRLCEESERHQGHAQKEMSKDLRKWTLGTYRNTARAVSALNPRFRGRMVKELGEDWHVTVSDLLSLRNDLSHGRVHEIHQLNAFRETIALEDQEPEELASYLRRIMNAAVFWWKSRTPEAEQAETHEARKESLQ